MCGGDTVFLIFSPIVQIFCGVSMGSRPVQLGFRIGRPSGYTFLRGSFNHGCNLARSVPENPLPLGQKGYACREVRQVILLYTLSQQRCIAP